MDMLEIEIRRDTFQTPWTYALLDQRQREIQSEILRDGARGKILLSEVAPVITLGRNFDGRAAGLSLAPSEIRANAVDLYRTDRGGKATYHGHGQWVLFVVERLDRLVGDARGVKETFRRLEAIALQVSREWRNGAEARDGTWSGIWSGRGRRAQKLASFGIKVDRGVLLHGVCINGFSTRESFYGIDPCGLPAKPGFLLDSSDESEFLRLGERIAQETWRVFG